jgi:hypothetical protein
MSKKTTRYQLTYPESTDHTRTWEHWQTLAQDVDLVLSNDRWTWVSATSGVNLPANTDYGVGPVTVTAGSSVVTAATDGIVSKVPGVFVWAALFYLPADTTRMGWNNPPGSSKLFLVNWYGGGADRASLAGMHQFTAAGQMCSWGWRTAQACNGNTFTLAGLFMPTQPA